MNGSKKDGDNERRGYHHGNLREALVRSALLLIAEKGPAGFTIADAARQAGVSPGAPYRHFRDRDALMADVGRRGFEELEARLTAAWSGGAPQPLAAFERIGVAYLAFAREKPAYYSAMFESSCSSDAALELRQASDRAFGVLREAAEAVCATLPKDRRPPALMMALHIWSLSHGIASLFGRSAGGGRKTPMAPEELLEVAVLIYFRGLGLENR